MAMISARDMQKIVAADPAPRTALAANVALMEQLAGEAARPALSLVVLTGLVRLADFAMIVATGLSLYMGYIGNAAGQLPFYALYMIIIGLAAVGVFQTMQAYSIAALRSPLRQIFRLAGAWGLVFLSAFALLFFLKIDLYISRVWTMAWFAAGFFALAIMRLILARMVAELAAAGRIERRAVVVGGGEIGRELLRDIAKSAQGEVRLLGVFDDRTDDRSSAGIEGFPLLGTIDDLVDFARNARLDLVIFALPITAENRILQMLRKLWVLPIDIRLAAHANRLRFRPRSYSYIGKVPVLDLFDKPIADWDVIVKLAFDKLIGALALLALSPVLALAALAIKLDSRGPIFFRQQRYGFNNELIEVFKFRSMYADQLDPKGEKLATRDDARVTRVGRFIRRSSIDELPQLINVVFKGNLSLVGPRPHVVNARAAERQYDEVVDGYFARHRVRPGMTGWAQVNGWRGETDTPEKIQARVEHDLYYIENWSILFDLYILAITPAALITTKNAY